MVPSPALQPVPRSSQSADYRHFGCFQQLSGPSVQYLLHILTQHITKELCTFEYFVLNNPFAIPGAFG
jgi:hypothetical protein